MTLPEKTILYHWHAQNKGKLIDFHGWMMPVQYDQGIIKEHLATRRHAGLFDVCHMGRIRIGGTQSLDFLQYALTNDAAPLLVGQAQYTIIANTSGGAIDDAYLYRYEPAEYLLVVNASNKDKDLAHLREVIKAFPQAWIEDISTPMAMIALQGPESETILKKADSRIQLPPAGRNRCLITQFCGCTIRLSRTGYTGEPVCFELFVPVDKAEFIWSTIARNPLVSPVGLGARDTLRLEANLPLYGLEFGLDHQGRDMEILACKTAEFGIDFKKPARYIGEKAILKQYEALTAFKKNDFTHLAGLPRRILPFTLLDKGIARSHCPVACPGHVDGFVTSGTTVPYWKMTPSATFSEETGLRSIGMALVDSHLRPGDTIQIQVRTSQLKAVIVKSHTNNRTGSVALPLL